MASRRRRENEGCLSPGPHDNNITDEYLHYTGCLRIFERENYFNTLPAQSQERIREGMKQAERLRARLEALPELAKAHQLHRLLNEYRICTDKPVRVKESCVNNTAALPDMSADSLIQAPIMFFKNGKPYDVPGLGNRFPNQGLSINELLTNDINANPLMQHDPELVRYFHVPANNMVWIEEAIARYYGEQPRGSHDCDAGTRTGMILRSEFWRAQRCFDSSSEVHARHMRALCDTIPIGTEEPRPSNMVLFMPYLHWETDKGRSRTAEKIRQINKENASMADVIRRFQDRQLLLSPMAPPEGLYGYPPSSPVANPVNKSGNSEMDVLANIDLKTKRGRRKLIGLILLTAAEIFEAMDFVTEDSLITEYLHADPPLHPRRTLDQFYYGSLKSTKTRDRDQVIYRATSPSPHKGCLVNVEGRKCSICQEESRKVPRLIMVDQLWLWVLDDNTMITSFPRRWGMISPDTSDIHESIRRRLKFGGNTDIKSAYDLALIVIDECSRVFFDRALDRRPKLVDIFSEAIGCIKTYRQAAAFDRFLIYSHIVSREFKKGRCHDEATQHILLNIKSEGDLLKEAMDIMDELQIMIRIMEEQQMVVETFIKQIEQASSSAASSPLTQTLPRAKRLYFSIESKIGELRTLLRLAKKSTDALKDLLTLKQQQAGVIEAREAVRNGEEVYKQGQSIMLFTVITIIFLPLSFISSLFGMNVVELNSGTLTFAEEFKFMFPIAAGVIILSFFLAFNHSTFANVFTKLIKTGVSFAYNIAFTWLAVKTGWYLLESSVARKTNSLRNKEVGITGVMKAEALRNEKNIRQMRASQELIKAMGKEPSVSRRSTFGSPDCSVLSEDAHSSGDVELGYNRGIR
ncbi:hypothetical protein F4677DRAFT_325871 [Hypoxylon crocopeplum]|nr:hypothetical protein F4677DRAFT_325871 [Hypoxylon crocopeplum]